MANELKHGSVGTELTQAEWEGIGTHVVANQAIGDLIYASSTSQLRRLGISGTGTYILSISGGVPVWAAPAAAAAGSLTGSTLASGVTASSLTSVGTIATGVWQGTDVGVAYGGTGVSTLTSNAVLTGNGASAITAEANLTFDGSTLTVTADVIIAGTTPTLTIGDAGTENTALVFDGNEVDFHIGLQDSSNDLLFGTGASVGSGRMMMLGDAVGGTEAISRLTIDDLAVTLTESAEAAYRALFLNMGNITLTSGTTVNNDGFSFLYIDKATLLATGGSVTVSEVNVLGIDIPTMASSTTGTAVAGIRIKDAGSVAGTMTTQYGIVIETLTAGATDVGIDMGSNTLINIGASGQNITATGLVGVAGGAGSWSATQLHMSGSTAGPQYTVRASNTENTNSASNARILAFVGGSSAGDPYFEAQVSGSMTFKVGVDNSNSRFAINRGGVFGTDDVIRVTNASPPVITYNTTHPTGTFDYVCESCGKHEAASFACCGPVEWHDDVMDFRAMAMQEERGLDYMERVGVIERSIDDGGNSTVFTNLGLDFEFAMSAAFQNRQRMDAQNEAMNERLARIEAVIGV
jgi:hypothetical protein